MGKESFNGNTKNVFYSSMDLEIRKRLAKWYVWIVLLCGRQTWTVGKRNDVRTEDFEIRMCRRMKRINWINRGSNEEVVKRIRGNRTFLDIVIKRTGDIILEEK